MYPPATPFSWWRHAIRTVLVASPPDSIVDHSATCGHCARNLSDSVSDHCATVKPLWFCVWSLCHFSDSIADHSAICQHCVWNLSDSVSDHCATSLIPLPIILPFASTVCETSLILCLITVPLLWFHCRSFCHLPALCVKPLWFCVWSLRHFSDSIADHSAICQHCVWNLSDSVSDVTVPLLWFHCRSFCHLPALCVWNLADSVSDLSAFAASPDNFAREWQGGRQNWTSAIRHHETITFRSCFTSGVMFQAFL